MPYPHLPVCLIEAIMEIYSLFRLTLCVLCLSTLATASPLPLAVTELCGNVEYLSEASKGLCRALVECKY